LFSGLFPLLFFSYPFLKGEGGKWVYLYRAVDSHGDTLDFMLSERRDEEAATAFFKQAINNNSFPDKVVMDKSGANYAGL
jgi:putative transposase